MTDFDVVWRRIVALEGETFRQRRGKPFSYAISGGSVVPSTTNRLLPRSISPALSSGPRCAAPANCRICRGLPILFAILTDPRIVTADAAPRDRRVGQLIPERRSASRDRPLAGPLGLPGSLFAYPPGPAVRRPAT